MNDRERRDVLNRLGGFPYRMELIQGLDRAISRRDGRQTGTTMALALQTISIAIQYPNTPVVIIDHHRTRNSDRYMADMMRRMISQMEFRRITVLMTGPSSPCVVHHPYKEKP